MIGELAAMRPLRSGPRACTATMPTLSRTRKHPSRDLCGAAYWAPLSRGLKSCAGLCIAFMVKRGDEPASIDALQTEMRRLIELCSSGSFYESTLPEGATPAEVKTRKHILNILLNSPNSRAAGNVLWRQLRCGFPHCLGIIDSIKQDNHRAISHQLQHFTANAITAALLEMQAKRLPAIPDTDCLIVRERDRDAACLAIGAAMHAETRGVCVTVGGSGYASNA